MKATLTAFVLLFTSLVLNAQDATVEKSIYGIQAGLGIWGNNELRLTDKTVLRSEIGFDAAVWGGQYYDNTGFLLTPVLSVEPRKYYNLNKRAGKGRVIEDNNGNFISLKVAYRPDWFVISNEDVNIVSDISFIPYWGIRRNLSNSFNYEVGIGMGVIHYFAENAGFVEDDTDFIVALHLRIGLKLGGQ